MTCVGDDLSVGACDHNALVLAERDKLGPAPCVKFVEHQRDVHDVIASCDVLLTTSLHEGFPNVVLEVMTCGTPVASTDYPDVGRMFAVYHHYLRGRTRKRRFAA
jgi:glycosyltransferase involved in cell wall biosynthesis